MNKRTYTPRMLLLIGVGFLGLTAWSIYRASHETSAVTDRDYYSHGLRYNKTMLERKAAESLGWTTAIELTGSGIVISLKDKRDQPVAGAEGELTLFSTSQEPVVTILLTEATPGYYAARLPAGRRGELPAEISFDRDGVRLNKRLLLAVE